MSGEYDANVGITGYSGKSASISDPVHLQHNQNIVPDRGSRVSIEGSSPPSVQRSVSKIGGRADSGMPELVDEEYVARLQSRIREEQLVLHEAQSKLNATRRTRRQREAERLHRQYEELEREIEENRKERERIEGQVQEEKKGYEETAKKEEGILQHMEEVEEDYLLDDIASCRLQIESLREKRTNVDHLLWNHVVHVDTLAEERKLRDRAHLDKLNRILEKADILREQMAQGAFTEEEQLQLARALSDADQKDPQERARMKEKILQRFQETVHKRQQESMKYIDRLHEERKRVEETKRSLIQQKRRHLSDIQHHQQSTAERKGSKSQKSPPTSPTSILATPASNQLLRQKPSRKLSLSISHVAAGKRRSSSKNLSPPTPGGRRGSSSVVKSPVLTHSPRYARAASAILDAPPSPAGAEFAAILIPDLQKSIHALERSIEARRREICEQNTKAKLIQEGVESSRHFRQNYNTSPPKRWVGNKHEEFVREDIVKGCILSQVFDTVSSEVPPTEEELHTRHQALRDRENYLQKRKYGIGSEGMNCVQSILGSVVDELAADVVEELWETLGIGEQFSTGSVMVASQSALSAVRNQIQKVRNESQKQSLKLSSAKTQSELDKRRSSVTDLTSRVPFSSLLPLWDEMVSLRTHGNDSNGRHQRRRFGHSHAIGQLSLKTTENDSKLSKKIKKKKTGNKESIGAERKSDEEWYSRYELITGSESRDKTDSTLFSIQGTLHNSSLSGRTRKSMERASPLVAVVERMEKQQRSFLGISGRKPTSAGEFNLSISKTASDLRTASSSVLAEYPVIKHSNCCSFSLFARHMPLSIRLAADRVSCCIRNQEEEDMSTSAVSEMHARRALQPVYTEFEDTFWKSVQLQYKGGVYSIPKPLSKKAGTIMVSKTSGNGNFFALGTSKGHIFVCRHELEAIDSPRLVACTHHTLVKKPQEHTSTSGKYWLSRLHVHESVHMYYSVEGSCVWTF